MLQALGLPLFAGSILNSTTGCSSSNQSKKTKIIREAHRGFSQLFPENTLLAFQGAIKTGVDRIELDLRVSADEKLVVFHDETLDRTTNGKGKVSDYRLDELKKLDAGSWKGHEFYGEKIPTLEEVFKLAKGNCFINIDLKDSKAVQPMVELAEKTDMIDQIVITGKIPECTRDIRTWNKRVSMFYEFPNEIVINFPLQAVRKIREENLPGSLIHYAAANDAFIRESKLHGLSVSTWGVLSEKDMQSLIDLGVDAIMTDNLDLLNKIIG